MTRKASFGAAGVLLGLTFSTLCGAESLGAHDAGKVQATQRHVSGIITAVDESSVTITPLQGRAVATGRVDSARTRVVIDGRAAKASDLRITYAARGELALDDVWISIVVDSNR